MVETVLSDEEIRVLMEGLKGNNEKKAENNIEFSTKKTVIDLLEIEEEDL